MTILVSTYPTKKDLKAAIGKPLRFSETAIIGSEYKRDGTITVARRPHLCGGGREFFARVTLKNGLITKVD